MNCPYTKTARDSYDAADEGVESQGFFAPNGAQNDIRGEKMSGPEYVILSPSAILGTGSAKDHYEVSIEFGSS